MKKKYEKPLVFLESFSLCTNIAGNCKRIVGNPSEGTCALLGTGGIAIFSGTMDACDYTPEDMGQASDQWDGFCYHVPTDEKDLFNS